MNRKDLIKEFRRLTKKANRRIKSHIKQYEKEGMKAIPKEIVRDLGGIQHKSQFETKLQPLSSSYKGKSDSELLKEINRLKNVVDNKNSVHYSPTVSEYADINRKKLEYALETSGIELSPEMKKNLNKMSTADISRFWKRFNQRGMRMGIQYSSSAIMEDVVDITSELKTYVNTGLKINKQKG